MNVARTVAAVASAIGLGALLAPPTVTAQPSMDPTVIVLDASVAMLDVDDSGRTRIDTVKTAVRNFLDAAPAASELGLVAYGTGTGVSEEERAAGCGDATVLGHRGDDATADLKRAVNTLAPRGFAPIGNALLRAAELLPASGARSMVLVAGGADSCAPPPACEVAAQLKQQHPELAIHTIGFFADDTAREELSCIAQATQGSAVEADSEEGLEAALRRITTREDQPRYQFPDEVVEFGKNRTDAPHVRLGTWEHPTRITARTLSESEEEDNQNMLKLSIPKGHRVQVGYTAVPKASAGAAPSGFVFSPKLQYERDGSMVDCPAHGGSGRGNFRDTQAPTTGYLVGDHYDGDSPCYSEDVFLDIGLMRASDFHDAVDIDMSLAAVPEPEQHGDDFNTLAAQPRQDADLPQLSPQENVVAVTPATQPDGAEELVGTTYGELADGQTHFYAVPVGWGQALDGTFEVLGAPPPEPPAEPTEATEEQPQEAGEETSGTEASRIVEIQAMNALGQSQQLIGAEEVDVARAAEPATFGTLYPVSYANVDAQESNATSFWLGGTHYIAVSLSSVSTADNHPAPLKYRLTLKPYGKPVAGPKFPSNADAEQSGAKETANTKSSTKASPVARTTGASPALKIVGGTVAASAVLITAFIVLVKTRKH
ncbi:VWA domain-containing protein [Corynebacterium sp.]|uniref:vWA domain-containing protein n=1 Tax=Corynebacterium sp. TaxID=1720 RepID=UPI0026DDC268|nr:VWA domain-containing protein [Corynebacterium sp.]MDO5077543.1 VWA domain-containing protein [Corynebacterium sp.]